MWPFIVLAMRSILTNYKIHLNQFLNFLNQNKKTAYEKDHRI